MLEPSQEIRQTPNSPILFMTDSKKKFAGFPLGIIEGPSVPWRNLRVSSGEFESRIAVFSVKYLIKMCYLDLSPSLLCPDDEPPGVPEVDQLPLPPLQDPQLREQGHRGNWGTNMRLQQGLRVIILSSILWFLFHWTFPLWNLDWNKYWSSSDSSDRTPFDYTFS